MLPLEMIKRRLEREREGWAVAEWRRELIESWIKLSFFVPAEKTRRDSI